MSGDRLLLLATFALAGVLFVAVGLKPAPYGRHRREPQRGIPARLGWFIMATPGWLVLPWLLFVERARPGAVTIVFLLLWTLAYVWRGWVYPLLLPGPARRLPVAVVALGLLLTASLAVLNGHMLAERTYALRWLWSLRFLYGLAMMCAGMFMSRAADIALTRLRRGSDREYDIPQGGLFGEISCPNYLGEIFMWLGWAITTWSQPGFACFCIAAALLVPRAVSHHLWYQRTFRQYPPSRRALLPFLL